MKYCISLPVFPTDSAQSSSLYETLTFAFQVWRVNQNKIVSFVPQKTSYIVVCKSLQSCPSLRPHGL